MKINKSLQEISDGKLYDLNDMVKADTRGCKGCSACCQGNTDEIVLNPFDMYEIARGTGRSYDELFGDKIDLHIEEKINLPHLKMNGPKQGCGFLDEDKRCSIHGYRPSICRMFPLGRYYENHDFKYIFKAGECIKPNLSKVKVKKWIGINNYNKNKVFILGWHELIKALRFRMKFMDDEEQSQVNAYIIDHFYRCVIDPEADFYEVMGKLIDEAKDKLGLL